MFKAFHAAVALLSFVSIGLASLHCKTSPNDANWPSLEDWSVLNQSIHGALLKTVPIASSCYPGNPFGSSVNCTDVTQHWSYAAYHSNWPESIDYAFYTNNSCLPPGVTGYTKDKGCSVGGLPQYIVNASTETQVATAMKWASERDIRIVVKGTGHDLNGRSTGAYSLSIWTHNFRHIQHIPAWHIPGAKNNETVDVLVCGSGNNWGSVYTAAHQVNRIVVGGEDATVGVAGLIQNGGHGLLSSTYGLASDQVYQATVITTDGRTLVANNAQNQDLFWAIRGGGGGQYGVVTEFVLKTHPVPRNIVTGGLTFHSSKDANSSEEASWNALAQMVALIPDLMDTGLTGTLTVFTKETAESWLGLNHSVSGAAATIGLIGYDMKLSDMEETVSAIADGIRKIDILGELIINYQDPSAQSYWSYTKPDFMASRAAGGASLFTSRLLGRRELLGISKHDLSTYLRRIMVSQDAEAGTMLLFGLQGGKGPASVPEEMRGSVLPAWRSAYAHVMAYGGSVNATGDPKKSLEAAAEWYETEKEPVWRDWAPNTGAYMNEGNPFSSTWKQDFYGEHYDRLFAIKRKYDPAESLFVWSGVGSDMWDYDLNSGLLCRVSDS